MNLNTISRVGFALGLTLSLTGCIYVREAPPRTVYVDRPAPAPAPPPPVVVHAPPPAPVHSHVEIVIRSEHDFHEPLAPHGDWIVVANYGRVWRPARVAAGWRPYTHGHWQRTTAGWFWVSDEPWAWATYHYGRWDWTPRHGWIWVPQTEWAPAWVTWRQGQGYIGWAPLPPSARIAIDGDVHFHDAALAPHFVFVEERRMCEPVRPTTVIVNNTTVINKTVNITKIKVVNKTVVNEGPKPEVIERSSGRRIQSADFAELRRRAEEQHGEQRRRSLRQAASPGRNEAPAERDVKAVLPKTVSSEEIAKPARVERPQPPVAVSEPAPNTPSSPPQSEPRRDLRPKEDVRPDRDSRPGREIRPGREQEHPAPVAAMPASKPEEKPRPLPAPEKKEKPAREIRQAPESTRDVTVETETRVTVKDRSDDKRDRAVSRLRERQVEAEKKELEEKTKAEAREKEIRNRLTKAKGRKGEAETSATTNAPAGQ